MLSIHVVKKIVKIGTVDPETALLNFQLQYLAVYGHDSTGS